MKIALIVFFVFGLMALALFIWSHETARQDRMKSRPPVSMVRTEEKATMTLKQVCKYCGKTIPRDELVDHYHTEHEESYQSDIKAGTTGYAPRLGSQMEPQYTKITNIPTCPTCGSTKIERFSRAWKVTKVATIGVFGLGNVHKIYRCKNCGYKW